MDAGLTLVHERRVADRFGGHATAALLVRGDRPLTPRPGAVDELRARVQATDGREPARRAGAAWREVYAAMGAKPRYQPSVQALLDTYEAAGAMPPTLALVELYCWFSVAHGVPMAGYDASRVAGPLRLTVPGKGRPFTAIGHANAQPERTRTGEVAYVDDEKVICRYWNCRDCDQTKLHPEVREALFVLDLLHAPGVPGPDDAAELTSQLAALLDGVGATAGGIADGTRVEEIRLAA